MRRVKKKKLDLVIEDVGFGMSPMYILEEDTSCPASSSSYFRIDLGRKACGFPSGPTHPHIWFVLSRYQGLCHLCNLCYTWAGGN